MRLCGDGRPNNKRTDNGRSGTLPATSDKMPRRPSEQRENPIVDAPSFGARYLRQRQRWQRGKDSPVFRAMRAAAAFAARREELHGGTRLGSSGRPQRKGQGRGRSGARLGTLFAREGSRYWQRRSPAAAVLERRFRGSTGGQPAVKPRQSDVVGRYLNNELQTEI